MSAVVLAGGERISARNVITAIDPKTALLSLLSPGLGEIDALAARELAAARRSNVVQAVVHVATDRLPAYPGGGPADHHGLQSYVDHVEDLEHAWTRAQAGLLTDPAAAVRVHDLGDRPEPRARGRPHRLPRLPRCAGTDRRRLGAPPRPLGRVGARRGRVPGAGVPGQHRGRRALPAARHGTDRGLAARPPDGA